MNTTLSALAPEPELAELWGRAIGSDEIRADWLEKRRGGLTATDMKVIGRSRPATVREHLRKKATGTDAEFKGNKATEWGKYRESVIVRDYAGAGFHLCGLLVTAVQNPRYLATPDIAGVNFGGEVELVEVKTSEKDLDPAGPDFAATRYLEQVLWQIVVTGAARVTLHVEQHDGDFSRWANRPGVEWEFADGTTLDDYGPKVLGTHTYVFEAADHAAEIAALVKKADAALAILDEELVGFVESGPETFTEEEAREYGAEGRRYANALAAEKQAKADKAAAQAEVIRLAAVQGRKAFSDRFDNVKITYSPEQSSPGPDVVDLTAAAEADPGLALALRTRQGDLADAKAALSAVEDQWAAHCEAFKVSGDPVTSQPKVTFTPPRGGTK